MNCRFCKAKVTEKFIDLSHAPASNSFLSKEQLSEVELYYPLVTFVCTHCWLVQIDECKQHTDIFNEHYAYYSSYSSSWLMHAQQYVSMIIPRLNLGVQSFVIEVASNDGYLLKNFVREGIPCLGIEPSENTALAAEKFCVPSIIDFFGMNLANRVLLSHGPADLIIGNNVLAHVPDINDFVSGLARLIRDTGTITMEFPHLLNLIQYNQFDTIYHEHFSYFSLVTVQSIFASHGLKIYDTEVLPTHGGSLRIYATPTLNSQIQQTARVSEIIQEEIKFGLTSLSVYQGFQPTAESIKFSLLSFLLLQKENEKRVVAYGAAAKGNTLLNFCGIKADLIEFVVDASPHKQNRYLPGSHIPIVAESLIQDSAPDFVVIFPWNIQDEIKNQLHYLRSHGTQFVVFIPKMTIS